MKESEGNYWAVIPADVLRDDAIPANAKLLYGRISALTDARGYCWATNKYLADKSNLTVKSVSRLIASLEHGGYLRSESVPTETGNERRIYAGAFLVTPTGGDRQNCPTPLGQKSPRGVDKKVSPPLYKINKDDKESTPLPPELKKRMIDYSENNDVLLSALYDFAELRRKKKKPLITDRQISLLLNKLDSLSCGDAGMKIAVLDAAVLHGWESVYAIKGSELPETRPSHRASEMEVLPEWT
ncbi:MAG: helix-turn-helix domain-containing protein [Oscillospiraceae bacterium]